MTMEYISPRMLSDLEGLAVNFPLSGDVPEADIAVVKVYCFQDYSSDKMRTLLRRLKEGRAEALVFDLTRLTPQQGFGLIPHLLGYADGLDFKSLRYVFGEGEMPASADSIDEYVADITRKSVNLAVEELLTARSKPWEAN